MDTQREEEPAPAGGGAAWTWLARAAAVFGALSVAGLAGAYLWFAHPFADDFSRGAIEPAGVYEYVHDHYYDWSGRWFAHTLEVLLLGGLDITQDYRWILAGLAAVYLLSIWICAHALAGPGLGWRAGLAATVLLGAQLWCSMPTHGATLGWVTGGIENHLGWALFGLLCVGLSRSRGWLGAVLLAPLAFCLPGLHEMFGGLMLGMIALGAGAAWKTRSESRIAWSVAFVALAAGLATVVLAPGNDVRMQADYGDAHGSGDLRLALRNLRQLAYSQFLSWSLDAKLLGLSLAFVVHARWQGLRPAWLNLPGMPWKWILPLASAAFLLATFFIPAYMVGPGLPVRTMNGIYVLFVACWFVCLLAWTQGGAPAPALPRRQSARLGGAGLLLFALGLLASPSFFEGTRDVRDRLPAWDAAMQERYASLRAAIEAGTEYVELEPPPSPPRRVPVTDIGTDHTHWTNVAVSEYFGAKGVRLRR